MTQEPMTAKQRKGMATAQQLLGPGTTVRSYAMGQAQARMTTSAIVIMSVFGAAFLAALVLAGVILVPGILVALLVYSAVRPYRGLAVTESGIVLFAVSRMNGRPPRSMSLHPFPILWPPYAQKAGRSVRVPAGTDTVTIREQAHRILLDSVPPPDMSAPAAPGLAMPYAQSPPPPPPPV